jgi:hypothetical protein
VLRGGGAVDVPKQFLAVRGHDAGEGLPVFEGQMGFGHIFPGFVTLNRGQYPPLCVAEAAADVDLQSGHIGVPPTRSTSVRSSASDCEIETHL